ncbi:diguanylate cyclase domain-containing protein [Sulfurimonas marina]|uniref:Diguanylate cyclase n=1 Tax=Sulfurimonas marina TaxID=2590551 RepID=A0A7M1AXU5_9BACT|nr:diguanylate cyclase [Sulfurimonas marina]QOP41202.1 diguanylate cyclase [Sulfurimonas marina]
MKSSIKKIFKSLKTYLVFLFLMVTVLVLFVFEHDLSTQKIDNLQKQKSIVHKLAQLDKNDVELALIQFNGKSTQLHQDIDKLMMIYKYNVTERYLLGNAGEYSADVNHLSRLIDNFNNAAHVYYEDILKNKKSLKHTKEEIEAKETLDSSLTAVTQHINTMLLKHIDYDETKFYVIKNISFGLFVIVLFFTFLYRSRLTKIYNDIEFLYQIDKDKKGYEIFSIEADAIALRMNRKSVSSDNPTMLDKVTGINNYKGMLNSYSHKKGLKDSNFTSVTVFDVDNFSKTHRPYPQDITQSILKKVAYTISLYEQPVDVIARTDYNQYTIILSRPTKEQCYKDAELIRESIADLRFNVPDVGTERITVTGGHVIKPNNTNLEEAIKQAKEVLNYAKTTGKNKTFQTRDLAQKDVHREIS